MPSKFGSISKAFTTKPVKDPDTILDLYVLSLDLNNKLITFKYY